MKTIQFPLDFTITTNPVYKNAINYIYQRPDGSLISILEDPKSEMYEIWDYAYMEYPENMDFYELTTYLSSTVSQLLTYNFLLNEDLVLN